MKDAQATEEAFSPQKRTSSTSKHENSWERMTHRNRKSEEILCFEVLDVHFWWLKAHQGGLVMKIVLKKGLRNCMLDDFSVGLEPSQGARMSFVRFLWKPWSGSGGSGSGFSKMLGSGYGFSKPGS
jgi:hypothetical protein